VAAAHRREWAYVLAATVRVTRDLDLAEECVQDAYASALVSWPRDGIPERPGGWLTTAARRRALDVIRRQATLRSKLPLLLVDGEDSAGVEGGWFLPDDRLRLIFTCCHPALSSEARVALSLRLLCGLSTAEVASAFLVSEPTMAARITRAKKKIAAARIPYRVPPPEELPERIDAVLAVVHLVFTTGHSAPVGADLVRADLVEYSLDLARLLVSVLPNDPEVAGLLALILLTDARRATRTGPDGRLALLEDQDRSRWDAAAISEGLTLLEGPQNAPAGRLVLQARIAAEHARAADWADTDWTRIANSYGELRAVWPSPVVALNQAVAIGFAAGPTAGLAALDALADDPRLASYSYYPAARAEQLCRLGRLDEARLAFSEALLLTENQVERQFLEEKLSSLDAAATE
jgi:RNA polymerase sigma factor (sigma-70 family)